MRRARAGRLEPLDRLNGGLIDWPSGTGWYAYGARFHEYLARAYGTDRIMALAKRTSGRFPYFTSGAFDGIYGKTLAMLWREFEASEMVAARAATDGRCCAGQPTHPPRIHRRARRAWTATARSGSARRTRTASPRSIDCGPAVSSVSSIAMAAAASPSAATSSSSIRWRSCAARGSRAISTHSTAVARRCGG